MKILFVSQHYWPEPFATTDVCEELVRRGHSVTVLTGIPNYPEGFIYAGYEDGANSYQAKDGVRVIRARIHPRKKGPIHRVWNYYSFARAASRLQKSLEDDFDVVMAYQTSPVMMAEPAIAYAQRTKTPLLLYCVDIWPECLTAGGIKRGSAVFNHFLKVSRRIYSSADALAVTSPAFEGYLNDVVGCSRGSVLYLPQFAEDLFQEQVANPTELYDRGKINFTFAGNVGVVQSVETIVETASLLKADDRFAFHIVGSGSELEKCKKLSRELGAQNVVFHGMRPLEEMPAYYYSSDAMLVTFSDDPVLSYTLPRKVQSYLAAGKPVIGAASGETQRVIEAASCGYCCDAENAESLAEACVHFAGLSSEERNGMGLRARGYYNDNFTRERFYETLIGELERLKRVKHGS